MRVTQLVEGMPLAIEIAAAWVRTLAPTEIAAEIEKGLDILVSNARNVPPRHASMRTVLYYSWRLLNESEQHVLARFAVLRGGFTREAAREVADASFGVLSALVLREVGQAGFALDAVGGLAAIALAQGNLQEALASAEALVSDTHAIDAVFDIEPFRIFFTCLRIFRACGDARADAFLERVYALLQTRALRIEDEGVRRMYLENVPWHRELERAWRQLDR